MSEQLVLPLDLHDDTTFDTFYAGRNDQLMTTLNQFAHGRGEQFVYLWGAHGVGRTHLLQACCHVANQLKLAPIYLPLKKFTHLQPEILENLEALHVVCVDDIHAIAGRPAWEEAFFHFYNRMRDANKRLIVAGQTPPAGLGLALPDLVSRLAWGISFQVHELTEVEKTQLLLWRAEKRGLFLSEHVVQYLLNHCQRNLADLMSVLNKLDQASLQAKRRLTVPFVKEVLKTCL